MSTLIAAAGFGLVTASILAIAAVGFTLQFGVTNILNLAYGDIMTAAAFIAYLVNVDAGQSIWLGMLAGGLFAALASALLNHFVYRPFLRRGTTLFAMIMVTLALSVIVQNAVLAIWGANFFNYTVTAGHPLHLGDLVFTPTEVVLMAIAVVGMGAVHLLLRYTRVGKAMRATAADATLARNCGIATDRVTTLAWLASGLLCGVAGVALALNTASFTAATGNSFIVIIIAAAAFGGIGSPYGAMLGALTLGLVSEIAAALINPDLKDVVAFVVLIGVLLVRPQGILSEAAAQKGVVAS